MAMAPRSAGAASRPRNDVRNTPQTKIGSRVNRMPGARSVITVTIMFSPESMIERPMRLKAIRYESMPSTFWSARGAYPVHPVVNPPRNTVERRISPAGGSSQKVSASRRGNAMLRAPIMIGTK